jgi:methionine-gamma-lyase
MNTKSSKFATKAVHAGQHPEPETGALVSPMFLTSTFVFTPEKMERFMTGDHTGIYSYGRSKNPTQNCFQEKVAALEGGEAALATGSGMAAISLAILGFVHSGDHIISCRTVYGGTYALFTKIFEEMKIEVTFLNEMTEETLEKAYRPNTKMVYLETILNPTIEILDIPMITKWAKRKGIASMIDNTFASPYIFRPIEAVGADIVVHSTTKYINGHGDHIGGVIVGNAKYIESLRSSIYQELGPVPSPFACWLGLRGLKTLHLRMRAHSDNAMAFARWLESNPKVTKVNYPGLESHPQHALAKELFKGTYSGMLNFSVDGGIKEAQTVINNLKMAYYAVSLGDLDTLVEHPATMTHGKIAPAERVKMGVPDNMIRVSVGIEDVEDIIADFDQALRMI